MAGRQEVENSCPQMHKLEAENVSRRGTGHLFPKPTPVIASSSTVALSKPCQTVPPTRDQWGKISKPIGKFSSNALQLYSVHLYSSYGSSSPFWQLALRCISESGKRVLIPLTLLKLFWLTGTCTVCMNLRICFSLSLKRLLKFW